MELELELDFTVRLLNFIMKKGFFCDFLAKKNWGVLGGGCNVM